MKKSDFNPESAFIDLCKKGNLLEIKKLLTVYSETDILLGNSHGLILASKNNHLDVVTYLLEKTKIGNDINIYKDQGAYLVACDNSKTEIIKKFFEHWLNNDIQKKHNPQIWEFGFSCAYLGHSEKTMRLFLDNDLMKSYADIHMAEDNCFIELYKADKKDLLTMLIFEYNIEMTKPIKEFLENTNRKKDNFGNEYKIDKQELKNMFEKRDFKNKLDNSYPEKQTVTKIKNKKI